MFAYSDVAELVNAIKAGGLILKPNVVAHRLCNEPANCTNTTLAFKL